LSGLVGGKAANQPTQRTDKKPVIPSKARNLAQRSHRR